jgi:succinate dehydrogenase / fumarate reductase membrane anchor subunit
MAAAPEKPRASTRRADLLAPAKSGTADAWHMRMTSAVLVPLSMAFVGIVLSLPGKDYAQARALLGHPVVAILFLLFIVASIYHMKLGMQSIIDDYVHEPHLKEWSLIANSAFAALIGLASAFAILKLSFT